MSAFYSGKCGRGDDELINCELPPSDDLAAGVNHSMMSGFLIMTVTNLNNVIMFYINILIKSNIYSENFHYMKYFMTCRTE